MDYLWGAEKDDTAHMKYLTSICILKSKLEEKKGRGPKIKQ